MNLLSNACKFTQDGEILVKAWLKEPHEVAHETEHSEIPDEKEPKQEKTEYTGRLYVSISDTGCGINEIDCKKLFRDFCTLKSNAHLNPNGVGLGLSICRKICNKLEGDITVESKLNRGSVFTFYIQADTQLTSS